jgi:soluble lytic murein transglycosylase-like protein
LPGFIGATVEVTGAVAELLPTAAALRFALRTDAGEQVPVAMTAPDPVVVQHARLRLLARVSADGALLQGIAVTQAEIAAVAKTAPAKPVASAPAKKAVPVKPVAPAKKAAPTTKKAPVAQGATTRYIAKVKAIAPSMSAVTVSKIVVTVLQRAQKYGVDPRLVLAVIAQESRFNPRAVSPVGARGLGQLMPGTARMLGVKNSYDIAQNIDGTVRYLATLLRDFNGHIPYVLSAYNAGPGNVKRYGGIPPFRETKHYVKVISAHYQRLQSEQL